MYIMISNIFFEELLERDSSYDSLKKHPEISHRNVQSER